MKVTKSPKFKTRVIWNGMLCLGAFCDIYLLQLGFHPLALVLTLAHKKARTVIYIRINNTVHRTHKIASITNKTIKQK